MDNQTSSTLNSTTPLTQTNTDMNASHQAYASTMASQSQVPGLSGSTVSSPLSTTPMSQSQIPPMQNTVTPLSTNTVPLSTPPITQPVITQPVVPTQSSPASTDPAGTPPQTPPVSPLDSEATHHVASGKMVFVLVIILVLIAAIGGYLLFSMYQKSQNDAAPVVVPSPIPTQPVASPTASLEEGPAVSELESVSPSDDVDALEKDVEGSDFSSVDEEVSTLEKEL